MAPPSPPRRAQKRHDARALLSLMSLVALAACRADHTVQGHAQGQPAAQPAQGSPPLPGDPALQVARFANGVTFLSRSVGATQQGVALALVVGVGSLAEQDDERGFAHLVEHLAVNGSLHSPRPELAQFQQQLGLSLGADANATTALTTTSYLLEVSGADGALLDLAVSVLAGWASELSVAPERVALARSEVLAELRSDQEPGARLQRRLMERWLAGSPYANRDPIGLEPVLQAATPERLARFHERWYQPQNVTVVANGDFDAEAMRRRVERYFAALPRAEHPQALQRPELPVASGHTGVALESQPGLPSPMVEVGLKRPAVGQKTEADYQRGLLDRLVAYLTRRRVSALASRPGGALASSDVILQWGDSGMFDALHVQGRAAAAPEAALAALLEELERISQHGFTPRELELARTALERDRRAEWSRRSKLRQQALELARRSVFGEAMPSWEQEDELHRRLLRATSVEELNRHGKLWAQGSERLLLVIGNERSPLPAEAALRDTAARVRQSPVAPYRGELDIPLMADPPSPGAVTSVQRIDSIDTQLWTLANGAQVIFKPLAAEKGRVSLAAASPGGTYRWRNRELTNALIAPVLIPQLGLGPHDPATTQRLLYEGGVQVTPWISDYREGVRGSAPVESVEQLFQALHLALAQPGRDSVAFDTQRQRLRENLAARRADPMTALDDEVTRQLWSNHPRYAVLPPEATDQMELELMRSLYLDRFGDVGDFTFVFLGDTTSERIEPLVQRYLASLPGSPRRDGAQSADARYRPGITRMRLEREAQAQAVVHVRFHGDEAVSGAAEGELMALRTYLELRLREELRERLGGVYGIDVSYELRPPPRQGHELGFRFECRPEQREQLERAAFTVVDELRRQGAPSARLEALNRQLQTSQQFAERSSGFWQRHLLEASLQGRDPAGALAEAMRVEPMTSARLQRAARRYLRSDQYAEALLLPGAPAAAPRR